jgi:hypothetical protein
MMVMMDNNGNIETAILLRSMLALEDATFAQAALASAGPAAGLELSMARPQPLTTIILIRARDIAS